MQVELISPGPGAPLILTPMGEADAVRMSRSWVPTFCIIRSPCPLGLVARTPVTCSAPLGTGSVAGVLNSACFIGLRRVGSC